MSTIDELAQQRHRISKLIDARAKTHHLLMVARTAPVGEYEQALRDDIAAMSECEREIDDYVRRKSWDAPHFTPAKPFPDYLKDTDR